jgi:hypothetical protein
MPTLTLTNSLMDEKAFKEICEAKEVTLKFESDAKSDVVDNFFKEFQDKQLKLAGLFSTYKSGSLSFKVEGSTDDAYLKIEDMISRINRFMKGKGSALGFNLADPQPFVKSVKAVKDKIEEEVGNALDAQRERERPEREARERAQAEKVAKAEKEKEAIIALLARAGHGQNVGTVGRSANKDEVHKSAEKKQAKKL